MKHLIEFPLEGLTETIIVEVDELLTSGPQRVALAPDQLAHKAKEYFNASLRKAIRPVATTLITELRSLPNPPNEMEAKFGLKMSMQVGAVITTAATEANFEITLKWKGE